MDQQRIDFAESAVEAIELDLPWPPSVNNYKGHRIQLPAAKDLLDELVASSRGRSLSIYDAKSLWKMIRAKSFVQVYDTPDAKAFRMEVYSAAVRAKARKLWNIPCRVTLKVYPPDRRRRDLSNLWKMVEDALVEAKVLEDDSFIREHHAYFMEETSPGGKVVVRIERLI